MNILLSADRFYPAQMGGPSNTIYWHAKAMTQAGHDVTVIATSQDLPADVPLNRWLTLDCGQVIYTKNIRFYIPINHIFRGWKAIRQADVVHVNSLFYPASFLWICMSKIARKPVIWSPHGELSSAALRYRPRLKWLLLKAFQLVSPKVWFHATSPAEVSQIRQHFGENTLIRDIPNRMELPKPAVRVAQPFLLFIGRLHPIKALDRLLLALSTSTLFRESNYSLLIAGPDSSESYTKSLTDMVHSLGLSAKVTFLGMVQGERKEQLYADARLLILPSHSENFGNVVMESMAQGTPVIASTHTPWQVLETEQAGRWISNEPDALREAIEPFLTMPTDQYEPYRERAIVWPGATSTYRPIQLSGPISMRPFRVVQQSKMHVNNRPMNANAAIDFHDQIAGEFDRNYDLSAAFQKRVQVWTTLFDRFIHPSAIVMDFGCGSGIFSHYLAEKGCAVTGIDGSNAMIALCNQKKKSANVRYERQTLPLPDDQNYAPADAVLMSSLLEYMDNVPQMLRQAHNLLKPNGLLLVSMPNQLSIYRRIERWLFRLTGWPRYVAHCRNYSTEMAFTEQLTELGFNVLEITYFSSHDPISRLLKPFLSKQYVNSLFVGVFRKQ